MATHNDFPRQARLPAANQVWDRPESRDLYDIRLPAETSVLNTWLVWLRAAGGTGAGLTSRLAQRVKWLAAQRSRYAVLAGRQRRSLPALASFHRRRRSKSGLLPGQGLDPRPGSIVVPARAPATPFYAMADACASSLSTGSPAPGPREIRWRAAFVGGAPCSAWTCFAGRQTGRTPGAGRLGPGNGLAAGTCRSPFEVWAATVPGSEVPCAAKDHAVVTLASPSPLPLPGWLFLVLAACQAHQCWRQSSPHHSRNLTLPQRCGHPAAKTPTFRGCAAEPFADSEIELSLHRTDAVLRPRTQKPQLGAARSLHQRPPLTYRFAAFQSGGLRTPGQLKALMRFI